MSDFKEFCLVEGLSLVQIIGARKAWNHQQAKIDAVKAIMNEYYTGSYEESAEMAGLISAALEGDGVLKPDGSLLNKGLIVAFDSYTPIKSR